MRRLLVYRLGSIGDTVVALPAFHLIRQQFPHDHITLLTNFSATQKAAPVVSVLPPQLFDDVIEYPLRARRMEDFRRLRTELATRKFSLAISLAESRGLWKSVRDYAFLRWCGIPEIRGVPFSARDLSPRPEPGSTLYRSETNRLLDRLRWLATIDANESRWWDLRLNDDEQRAARAVLAEARISRRMVAFSIGTKASSNDWSQDNWKSLVSRLSDKAADYSLVAIGAEDERARSQELLDLWPGEAANLCGRASPRVSACVLQHATMYVGHDSGPLHLAAAVGTPCVAIYSARIPPGVWFPRGNHILLYNKTPCFGCGLETCVEFDKQCILSISVGQVADAVEASLGSAGGDRETPRPAVTTRPA